MSENIFLFVPNLIGYARIALAFVSFYFMTTDHVTATVCYLLSYFLDDLDGPAARYFKQETKFGALMDMLTDRCATTCLLVVLSVFYQDYMFLFQLSLTLDITSHWLHMHASVVQGAGSHKFIDTTGNPVMRFYYTSKPFLFFMTAGNELFYAMLYLLHFVDGPSVFGVLGLFKLIAYLTAPVALAKSVISLVQLFIASRNMAIIDVAEREASSSQKAD